MDELIAEFAGRLQMIYNERTAGGYTFHGALLTFLDTARSRGLVTIHNKSSGENMIKQENFRQ